MQEIFLQLLDNIFPTILGVGTGWFVHRAKSKTIEIDNKGKIIDMYKTALDDMNKRNDEKFKILEKEIDLLRKNVELWKGKYRDLKKEFEEYKNNVNKTPANGK